MYACLRPLVAGLSSLLLLTLLLAAGCEDSVGTPSTIVALPTCDTTAGPAPLRVKCHGNYEGIPMEDPVEFAWDFGDAPGAEPAVTRNPQHTFYVPGDYVITLTVTHVPSGDSASGEVPVSVSGAPNLTVTGVEFDPTALDSGEDLTVSFTVKNQGTSDAGPSVARVKLALDPNVSLNSPGRFIEPDIPIGGIAAGSEVDVTGAVVTVPPTTETSDYFIGVCVDFYDDVDETEAFEADNCDRGAGSASVRRLAQFPDLRVSDVALNPSVAFEEARVDVRFVVENTGERAAVGFHFTICAVPGPEHETCRCDDEAALELKTGRIEALPAEDQIDQLIEVGLPKRELMPEGFYCVAVAVDVEDDVQELHEDNNTGMSPALLEVIGTTVDGVDLLVSRVAVEPQSVAEDGSLVLETTFWNRGKLRAVQHVSSAVLSPERDFDHPEAEILLDWNLPELRAGAAMPASGVAPLRRMFAIGRYYLCIKADRANVVPETVESNNVVCHPEPIQVGETQDVDLEVSELTFGPLAEDPHPCGHPLDVAFSVRNNEPSISDAFVVRFYLSPDDTIERNDFQIDEVHLDSLGAAGHHEVLRPVIPRDTPEQVERWFIGAYVDPDDLVDEMDERNNKRVADGTLALKPGTCHGGCGDDGFEPNDSVAHPARIAPGLHEALCIGEDSGEDWFGIPLLAGESMTVEIAFDQLEGDLDLELYDASGINLLDRSASGADQEVVRVPLATVGTLYFVAVKPARAGVENRYDMTVDIRPPLQGTDLAPGALRVMPGEVILGEAIEVTLDVVNLGLVSAEAFAVDVTAIKPDEQATDAAGNPIWDIEGNAVPKQFGPLTTVQVPAAPALGTQPVTLQVVLPEEAGPGEFQLAVDVDLDDVVEETDEENNRALSVRITHVLPPEDCAASDDEHEPNNTVATALPTPMEVEPNTGAVTVEDLVVCEGFDDWWTLDLEEGDHLKARINFVHRVGDLDLILHRPSDERAIESRTRNNKEEVQVCGAEAGTWLLQAHYHGGGGDEPWNDYRMTLELNRCAADAQEPNDSCEEAAEIGAEGLDDLWLCADDVDVYAVQLFAGFPVTICADPDFGDPQDLTVTLLRGCQFVRTRAGCLEYEPRADDVYEIQVTARSCLIRGYDLTIEGLDGADVAVTELSVAPDEVPVGLRPQVTGTIRNTLILPVGPFDYELRLSEDGEITDEDVLLQTWHREEPLPRGQRIDIDTKVDVPEALAAGDWRLGLRLIPGEDVVDRSAANNVRTVPLTLVAACEPDDRDPDDDVAPGSPAAVGEHVGTLCLGDADWYAVDLEPLQTLTAVLEFEHDDGDLDLWSYYWDGVDEVLLDRSEGSTDTETLVVEDPGTGGTYLLQVLAGRRGVENAYTLEVQVAP